MVLGLDPRNITGSESSLKILILVEIALSLLISDSWSAVLLSTLVNTPVVVMLLGGGSWCLLGFEVDKVWISIEIAGGFGIGEAGIAGLDSLLPFSILRPMLLGFIECSHVGLLDNIWVSIEVALSLLVSHVTTLKGILNTLV